MFSLTPPLNVGLVDRQNRFLRKKLTEIEKSQGSVEEIGTVGLLETRIFTPTITYTLVPNKNSRCVTYCADYYFASHEL